MAHSSTELLIDYWQTRFRGADAPTRASINPADFPTVLPQVFILGRHGPGDYSFRLAGTFLDALHGRDLRGLNFSNVWAKAARLPIQTELERARRLLSVARVQARVEAGVQTLDLEVALMPLANNTGEIDRFLGIYAPKQPLGRLRGLTADRLQLLGVNDEATGELAEQPRLRLAAVGGERVG